MSSPQTLYAVLERGWLSSNSIVFAQGEQTAVVDTGYCTHAAQTLALIQSSLAGRSLALIVNTHLHSDHCGGNAILQAHDPTTQIFIPPGSADAVRRWDEQALSYAPTGQNCPRFNYYRTLEPGNTILLGNQDWEIHAAPGHDPHSIVLFEPESRTLISADALWNNGFGVVFQELDGLRAFDEVAQTLDLIERLCPKTVIPGHGPVFNDVLPALARARSRLETFIQDPLRHASYAAKVLIKYKLLEWQRCTTMQLQEWVQCTPYFSILHRRFYSGMPSMQWIDRVIDDLKRSAAIEQVDDILINLD
jgi:glyoxylase-like metal-dependent hydrolase (beta-lactamase superfamily II)